MHKNLENYYLFTDTIKKVKPLKIKAMTLIKNFPDWNNWSDFFDDHWVKSRFNDEDWTPAVNVSSNSKDYGIELAAPGFKKEDFHVTVDKGALLIEGKSENKKEEVKKNYTRKEFSSRSFIRRFTLPEDVTGDVDAHYEDGILHLTLKKTEEIPERSKEIVVH